MIRATKVIRLMIQVTRVSRVTKVSRVSRVTRVSRVSGSYRVSKFSLSPVHHISVWVAVMLGEEKR